MKLQQIKFENGDRLWTVIRDDGIPDFMASTYLVSRFQSGIKLNTTKNIATGIRIVRMFEKKMRISIEDRIKSGRILSLGEINELIGMCGKKIKKTDSIKTNSNVMNIKKPKEVSESNERNTQVVRVYYAGEFIKYLIDEILDWPVFSDEKRLLLEKSKERFIKRWDKQTPSKIDIPFNPNKALTVDEAGAIGAAMKDINSELAKSIFKRKTTRKRNLLIVELLLSTGIRESELGRLLIKDVVEEELLINIVENRVESKQDIRKIQPGFKTNERPIKINESLMRRLVNYMTARKGGRPLKAKHSYVFCASGPSANALSLSSIYSIVKKLEKIFGAEFKTKISPHVLRHTFFDIWFREADQKYDFKNNPHLFDQVIASAELTGGWQPDSAMVSYYKQRYVFEQASEITLKTQNRMMNRVKNVR